VTKDDSPTPNSGKITVYNLSRDTVNSLSGSSDDLAVMLWSGYGDSEPGLLFAGDITKVTTTLEDVDRQTVIESGDGQQAVSTARVSKSYGPQTSASDMVGDMAGKLADKLGMDKDKARKKASDITKKYMPDTPSYPRGLTVDGPAAQEMSKVLRANKMDWTIQDGELIVYKPGEAIQTDAFVLSPETGLIGSPSLTDKGRLEVKALCNSEFRPGRLVSVESDHFTGFYVIRRVKHSGDSGWSKDFYSVLECTEAD
jgi:hypothetical protein